MTDGYVTMKRLKLLEKRQRAGYLGGKSRSAKKSAASRENMRLARRKANQLKHEHHHSQKRAPNQSGRALGNDHL